MLSIMVDKEQEEMQEAEEGVPVAPKDRLLHQEVLMLLLQEHREDLELTQDMGHQEVSGELLEDMQGMPEIWNRK
jgi:hypothetical protein